LHETQEDNDASPVTSFTPTFSIIIPAHNEETRIRKPLLEWTDYFDKYFPHNYEVIVIIDGCSDQTSEVIFDLKAEGKPIIPLIYSEKLGKGGALIQAFKNCRGLIYFFTDADGALPPDQFTRFMNADKLDLVIGNRYFRGSHFAENIPVTRFFLSRSFNSLLKLLFPELQYVYDTQCGAKAIRREVIETVGDALFITDFSFDVNLIYSTLRHKFHVQEVRVDYNHVEEGSKVSSNLGKTSFLMLLSILRLRIYYSRWRQILNQSPLKGILSFLMKAIE
jgi:glycosyltransferase involved in cell wall biosynthesis